MPSFVRATQRSKSGKAEKTRQAKVCEMSSGNPLFYTDAVVQDIHTLLLYL